MIQKLKNILAGATFENESLRDRLFHLMIFMGAFASTLALIVTILLGEAWTVVFPLLLGIVVLWMTLWVSRRFHKTELMSNICVVVIDLILFPAAFFTSGAVQSGMNAWFVLALVFIFLLFSGKRFFVWLFITIAEYIGVFGLAYLHPEWITPLGDSSVVYLDSLGTIIIVATAIGVVIKFQIMVFTREKEVTEAQKEEIERISNSRNAFFVNISHEIRTPINTIIGLNEMILREEVSDEIAENALNVQNAGRILLTLINDILDMSKIESGKMQIVEAPYHLGEMLSNLVNIMWINTHEKNLDFQVQIAPDIPSVLFGDEVRVKQMILNLLSNAVKYTEKGSVILNVRGEQVAEDRVRLIISVEDTGIGIRKEVKESLFDPFTRAEGEADHKIEGTGLGLTITRQLAELMGGEISVDSVYMKGSVFTLTFEQGVVQRQPLGQFDFVSRSDVKNRIKYRQSFEAPRARVLIVDDNEMNRLVTVKLLRATRINVDTAASGEECLRKTLQEHYNVILMDHKMPGMDGVETLKALRKQEEGMCQNIPVIALTANAMNDARQIYQEYGFSDYLEKPVNGKQLEQILLGCLPEELVENCRDAEDQQGVMHSLKLGKKKNKRKVIITTDCVCDLPQEWLEHLHVRWMYYYVHVNGARFCDGKEIQSDNLMEHLSGGGDKVYSEAASVKEYEVFFAEQLDEADKVIHISMARHVSRGYEQAKSAAECFDNVVVVDSGQLSSGMGIAVLMAARMAEQKQGAEEILQMLNDTKRHISSSFIVASTDRLYETEKIAKGIHMICRVLQLHPVLELSGSRLHCHRAFSGEWKRAVRKYVQRQMRHRNRINPSILFVTSCGVSRKQLEEIASEAARYVKFERVVFQKASTTVSSNCGKGTVGLLFVRDGTAAPPQR